MRRLNAPGIAALAARLPATGLALLIAGVVVTLAGCGGSTANGAGSSGAGRTSAPNPKTTPASTTSAASSAANGSSPEPGEPGASCVPYQINGYLLLTASEEAALLNGHRPLSGGFTASDDACSVVGSLTTKQPVAVMTWTCGANAPGQWQLYETSGVPAPGDTEGVRSLTSTGDTETGYSDAFRVSEGPAKGCVLAATAGLDISPVGPVISARELTSIMDAAAERLNSFKS